MDHEPANQELTGKVALVTGGGSGIGEGIARRLATAGAAVAISGRRLEPLQAVVHDIEQGGGRALALGGDVRRPEDGQRMVAETVQAFGGLHLLVNNAGIARGGPLAAMSDEDIDATIDIDLKGPIHLMRAALPELRKHRQQGGAVVINISSSVSQSVLSNFSVYSAAKAGLDQLTRCWALELAGERIRVNAINPGVVATPIFKTVMSADDAEGFLQASAGNTPLGRVGTPADIAELALFLASERSAWMTGTLLTLDGGISLAGDV